MNQITFICDRCGTEQEGAYDENFTAGYYNVAEGGAWHRFARPMENLVCDHCMWSDPEYQRIYYDRVAAQWREENGL